MNRIAITLLAALTVGATHAEFIMKIPMEHAKGGPLPNGSINITPRIPGLPVENWQPAEPIYSEWVNVGDVSGCSNWAPDASTMLKDEAFNQTATDCKQTQSRTRQDREQETTTLAYRNVGEPVILEQIVSAHSSRKAIGTKENWQPAEPIYSEWVNVGDVSGCSNWAPDASTMLKDEAFNQTATDCKQTQSRTRQDREQETTTLAYRNVGEPVILEQIVSAHSSRKAIGTKENWQPAEPLYSEWVDFGNVYGCSNWTPDASTMLKDETFNQTAKDCLQYQTRTRQNREQETTTLAYRNVGERVTMGQNVTASSSRTATGTASCSYSRYVTGTPNTYWMAGTSSAYNAYIVEVNGVQIRAADGYYTASFTLNGKTYKRGKTVKDSITGYRYYEVCK